MNYYIFVEGQNYNKYVMQGRDHVKLNKKKQVNKKKNIFTEKVAHR